MQAPPTILAESFRDVMAGVPTPVSVVTAMDGQRPHGTTVGAFASLSMNPPMVLAALDRGSDLLEVVRAGGRFGVNVLASSQSEAAKRFACKGQDKFAGATWWLEHGLPRLAGTSGWLACGLSHLVDGGDHVIMLGTVLAANRSHAAALTYHERAFGTHAPLEVS